MRERGVKITSEIQARYAVRKKNRDPQAWREERAEGKERKIPGDGKNGRKNGTRHEYSGNFF